MGSIKELSHNASGSRVGVRDNEAYYHDRAARVSRVYVHHTCAQTWPTDAWVALGGASKFDITLASVHGNLITQVLATYNA